MPLDRGGGFLDEQALLVFGKLALPLRVGAAVTDQFGIGECRNGLGCMPVHLRIDEERAGEWQFGAHLRKAGNADTMAAVAPGIIEHIRLWSAGCERGAQALAE